MQVWKYVFDELTFNQNGDEWTTRFATEEMADEVLKRCNMHDRLLRALEECRDMICEECADGEYHEVADRALDLLKEADQ